MGYRVKTVAAMTGISRGTLLAWERRYAILDPDRTGSGYREYSDADVALLRRLKALVDRGHPIGEAVSLARRSPIVTAIPRGDLVDTLLSRLRTLDAEAARALLPEVEPLPFAAALDGVYLPLLQRTGDEWAAGTLTIAQEHFVSGWCRERMIGMLTALGRGPATGPRILCATAPGESHELGLLAVAIRLALAGWRVTWLGADLPVAEIAKAARADKPRAVAISLMRSLPEAEVLALARSLRDAIDARTPVWIGGPGARGLEARSTKRLGFFPTYAAAVSHMTLEPS